MIPESAMGFIQAVGQTLFQETSEQMADRDWETVALDVRYDGTGSYDRNCILNTAAENGEPIAIELSEAIDAPLQSLETDRIDANGKEWVGISVAISKAGEVKVGLGYPEG